LNIYARKRNFEIISRKLNKYYDTKFDLFKGNDLRYNNYIRKLTKLSKNESLDERGYQDYVKHLKELQDTKLNSTRNLAKYLLDELISKQNKEQELREFITQVINKGDNKINIDNYMKWSEKDTKVIIDSLVNNFENETKKIFKLSQYNHLTDKEFQDIKNLRIAKFAIKLRQGLMNNDFRFTPKEKDNVANKEIPSIHEILVTAKPESLPLFDKELYKLDGSVETYDDLLFYNINKYVLSTETFKQFKEKLFDADFYGETVKDYKNLTNPNIYSINDELIDDLILELTEKLRKSYELNDIYRDEEDLNTFKKAEVTRSVKRNEMNLRINQLKEKYGNIDILYDDYQGSEEKKKEVRKFKEDFKEEIESELDPKFKAVFELIEDDRQLRPSKFDKVEPEEKKKHDEKVIEIRKKIMDEINLKKQGKWVGKNIEKVENKPAYEIVTEGENITLKVNKADGGQKTPDEILEQKIRSELERKYLNQSNTEEDKYAPYYDNKTFNLSPGPEVKMPEKKWPRQKIDNEDEIKELNRKKAKFNDYILYSWEKTRKINMERKNLIKKRFLEYFGKYNDIIYADGYRHFENLDKYQMVHPDKNLAEYTGECK
jgi:hypothetical protein